MSQKGDFDEIVDVRSPAEFAEDHVPGAVSAPVLDDAERACIGLLHKQASAFEAKRAGAALVAANIARHLTTLFAGRPKSWRPLVYCWRGGQRSGSMVEVFTRIGWRAAQLDGGYKAYRRHVIGELERLPRALDLRIVCGVTGSGKSRMLRALIGAGAQVLDLEELARHRGSVLGNLPGEVQPSQKMFESLLAHKLAAFDVERPVYAEAESKKVGSVQVPTALIERMRRSTCLRIEIGTALRIALLKDEYAHFLAAPRTLDERLDCLVDLHGHARVAEWKALSAKGAWDALVEKLLLEHYDPAYLRGMARNYVGYAAAPVLQVTAIDEASMRDIARAVVLGASLPMH